MSTETPRSAETPVPSPLEPGPATASARIPEESEEAKRARKRAKQLFSFLKAYSDLRRSLVTTVAEEQWSLPLHDLEPHPAVVRRQVEGSSVANEPFLTVARAETTRPPAIPPALSGWLDGGCNDPSREPRWRTALTIQDQSGVSSTERFEDDPSRMGERSMWQRAWEQWAAHERPARTARFAYEELFKLRNRLEREGETLELLVGNGRLRQRTVDGTLDYPVLLQRVVLEFDPDVPEFRIRDADRDAELNVALIQRVPGVQGELLAQLREELEANDYHPLGEHEAVAWLRSLIRRLAVNGELHVGSVSGMPTARPVLIDAPLLLLRRRSVGVSEAMERAVRALDDGADVPSVLWRIVGLDEPSVSSAHAEEQTFRPDDALLSKPANDEQVDLIRQLESRGSVLVQGPPGTGKSHTIANLIGHLVATGQRVLVTSHTTKALRVLRDHVVENLRPLCVSLLDNDREARSQLEAAITHLQRGMQRPSDRELERQDHELTAAREQCARQIATLRREVLTIRQMECTPIQTSTEQLLPLHAAKYVRSEAARDGWIAGPVALADPLPLGVDDLRDLYSTNGALSLDDERQLIDGIPEVAGLLREQALEAAFIATREEVPAPARTCFQSAPSAGDGAACDELAHAIGERIRSIDELQPWEREVVGSSVSGNERLAEWREFATLLEDTVALWRRHRSTLIEADPRLPTGWRRSDTTRVLAEMKAAVGPGKKLGRVRMFWHAEWRAFVAATRAAGGQVQWHEDILAMQAAIEVDTARERLRRRWDAQVASLGLCRYEQFGERPEEECEPFAKDLRFRLGWWAEAVETLVSRAAALDLDWPRVLQDIHRGTGRFAELERQNAALRTSQAALLARGEAQRILRSRAVIEEQRGLVACSPGPIAQRLLAALAHRDSSRWASAFQDLVLLTGKREILARRTQLLAKLKSSGPGWEAELRERRGVHGGSELPGDAVLAWRWRQFEQELRRQMQLDEREIAERLEQAQEDHRNVTGKLIEVRTWRALRRRTGRAQQQALVGWADLMRKVGKGTGKRAPRLLAEARKQLDLARDAVPVWIMPLARVFETINPETTRFDVVVVDEASQADVTALFAVFLGARAVVVGDHEQVSPGAVGEKLEEVDRLIDQHLASIPNSRLYVGTTSIYDLARQSFPGQLRLVEHFRCVSEIIGFSNRLSYNGEIRPLRESSSALSPHLVEHMVTGHRDDDNTNAAEAEAVACLVAAVLEQREYKGKSVGVVSLLGDEQALLIDEYLRRRIAPRELQDRKVICGNAAQFQGDERDIMFLTMVDSPQDGPLQIRARDMFKQRYNVAASRARNQMWLIHSLDPVRDLQANDLRLGLIQHVRDPNLLAAEKERAQAALESPFEAEVVRRLVHAGFRIRTQVCIGAYRIGIVVIGERSRIALECDGEKAQPPEKLELDLARQMVLERLGWRFLRLRGSRFYRDPEAAMKWLQDRLEERQVLPLGPEEVQPGRCTSSSSSLVDRVRRRAAELQREWFPRDPQTS